MRELAVLLVLLFSLASCSTNDDSQSDDSQSDCIGTILEVSSDGNTGGDYFVRLPKLAQTPAQWVAVDITLCVSLTLKENPISIQFH